MLRKKSGLQKDTIGGGQERAGVFQTFFTLCCMRLASRRTLMGTNAANRAYGGHNTPLSPHVPISFVSELFLHLGVLAGVGHNHRQERRNCKKWVGGPRGNNNTTYLCYLTYLALQNFPRPYADIAINLYLHPLPPFFPLHFLSHCLAVWL